MELRSSSFLSTLRMLLIALTLLQPIEAFPLATTTTTTTTRRAFCPQSQTGFASSTTMTMHPYKRERRRMSMQSLASKAEAADEEDETKDQIEAAKKSNSNKDVGGYDPSEKIEVEREVNVGDPQLLKLKEKDYSVTSILKELAAIQQQGPQKYCILGTRHCSFLHQQIIELLAYALVLSGNHVYTSGAGGTHAATIRGALRAERPDLLTVVLPQSMGKQAKESQELLEKVEDIIAMPQNDDMPLDLASRICNNYLLSQTDQLISFAFHESTTVIEATKEAKKLDMLVTVLYLD